MNKRFVWFFFSSRKKEANLTFTSLFMFCRSWKLKYYCCTDTVKTCCLFLHQKNWDVPWKPWIPHFSWLKLCPSWSMVKICWIWVCSHLFTFAPYTFTPKIHSHPTHSHPKSIRTLHVCTQLFNGLVFKDFLIEFWQVYSF